MTPKIKNIIIFVGIAVVLILIYIFFIKSSSEQPDLVSSSGSTSLPNMDGSVLDTSASKEASAATEDFLALLLSVQKIQLDDAIFSDPSFSSLHDSSITIAQDNTEGRPNPFAQFGNDAIAPPVCTLPQVLDTATNTCVNETPN